VWNGALDGAYKIGLDASYVYWSAGTSIWKCAVGGCGNSPTQVATGADGLIGVDSTAVYYFTSGGVMMKIAK
jgi:hypothetical protein